MYIEKGRWSKYGGRIVNVCDEIQTEMHVLSHYSLTYHIRGKYNILQKSRNYSFELNTTIPVAKCNEKLFRPTLCALLVFVYY